MSQTTELAFARLCGLRIYFNPHCGNRKVGHLPTQAYLACIPRLWKHMILSAAKVRPQKGIARTLILLL